MRHLALQRSLQPFLQPSNLRPSRERGETSHLRASSHALRVERIYRGGQPSARARPASGSAREPVPVPRLPQEPASRSPRPRPRALDLEERSPCFLFTVRYLCNLRSHSSHDSRIATDPHNPSNVRIFISHHRQFSYSTVSSKLTNVKVILWASRVCRLRTPTISVPHRSVSSELCILLLVVVDAGERRRVRVRARRVWRVVVVVLRPGLLCGDRG